jgi:hypothetical protein
VANAMKTGARMTPEGIHGVGSGARTSLPVAHPQEAVDGARTMLEAAVHARTPLEAAVHARQPSSPGVQEVHPSAPAVHERQPSSLAVLEVQLPPAVDAINSESPSRG